MQSNKQNHNYCNDTVIMCHIYYFFMIFFFLRKTLSCGSFLLKRKESILWSSAK